MMRIAAQSPEHASDTHWCFVLHRDPEQKPMSHSQYSGPEILGKHKELINVKCDPKILSTLQAPIDAKGGPVIQSGHQARTDA